MIMEKEVLFAMFAEQQEDAKPLKGSIAFTGKVALVTGIMGLALHYDNVSTLAEAFAKRI